LDPESPNHKLVTLIDRYGLEGVNSHNALDDVKATAMLVLSLEKLILVKKSQAEIFLSSYSKLFVNVDAKIGADWRAIRKPNPQPTNFGNLFDFFLKVMSHQKYSEKHIENVKRKLIRHMDYTSVMAPANTLLNSNLHRYNLYKEPDLILDDDQILVSTIHKAKGLEFNTVIIPSCHSDNFPSYFARKDPTGLEIIEDKRILYVALTRAKKQLIILSPDKYYTRSDLIETDLSTFIKPIFSHFKHIRLPLCYGDEKLKKQWSRCPCCGRTWPWDGSYTQDNRCFGCGRVPEKLVTHAKTI